MKGPAIFTPEYYQRMRELEATGWWNAGMRDVAARLLAVADLPEKGRVLDVGCGSGQTLAWFRSIRPAWSGFGFDVAAEGLAAARAFAESVFEASALEIPMADGTADLAVMLDVLQHLPLPDGDRVALRELHRVLKPGGVLLLRTNAQSFPHTPDDVEYDFHKYEDGEMREKLVGAGFEVIRCSRVNALLGLAEIPRELRALRREGRRYHGILSTTSPRPGVGDRAKRRWLAFEGSLVARGLRLPLGRTLMALCRRPA